MKPEDKTREEIITETRDNIKKDYEWTEEDDKEKIDKMAKKEQDLHDAIKSKKNHRKKAEDMEKGKKYYKKIAKDGKEPDGNKKEPKEVDEERLEENMEARSQIRKLKLSDELKKEIKDYAEFKNVSLLKALESKSIKAMIKEEVDEEELENANLSNNHKKSNSNKKEKMTDVKFDKISALPEKDRAGKIADMEENEFNDFQRYLGISERNIDMDVLKKKDKE